MYAINRSTSYILNYRFRSLKLQSTVGKRRIAKDKIVGYDFIPKIFYSRIIPEKGLVLNKILTLLEKLFLKLQVAIFFIYNFLFGIFLYHVFLLLNENNVRLLFIKINSCYKNYLKCYFLYDQFQLIRLVNVLCSTMNSILHFYEFFPMHSKSWSKTLLKALYKTLIFFNISRFEID